MTRSWGTESGGLRAVALWLHRYVGLLLTVFLLVAGLTGSLLVFYHELDATLNPELMRVQAPRVDAKPMDPFALQQRVREQLPPTLRYDFVALDPELNEAISAWVESKPGVWSELFVDPYRGDVLGMREWGNLDEGLCNLMPFIYRLHYSLALGQVGVLLFGVVALLWTFDCFVGLYLTFPRGEPARAGQSRRSWLRRWLPAWLLKAGKLFSLIFSWHRASGLWLWGMLLVLAWSAVGLNLGAVYQPVMGALLEMRPRVHDTLAELSAPYPDPTLSWPRAHEIGRRLMAEQAEQRGFEVQSEAWLAYEAHHGLFSYGVHSSLDLSREEPQTEVYFDRNDGLLVAFDAPSGITAGNTLTNWLYALHFGQVWGLPYRLFLVLMGPVVCSLGVTGVWIWWRKRTKRALQADASIAERAFHHSAARCLEHSALKGNPIEE